MTDPLDTITIELPREVAERWAHLMLIGKGGHVDTIIEACRDALTNPTRSDEVRLAAEYVNRIANEFGVARVKKASRYEEWTIELEPDFKDALDNLSVALSKTVEDPPPTATEEGPQSVSEGADRARVSDWARAVGPAAADRYLAGETASDVADDFCVGDWTSEQVVEALAAVERNARDDASKGAESSRGGDVLAEYERRILTAPGVREGIAAVNRAIEQWRKNLHPATPQNGEGDA